MATFEQIPSDDQNRGLDGELLYGKYSLTEEEKKEIREQALKNGQDPEEAIRVAEGRMKEATARLREKQSEDFTRNIESDQ